MSRRLALIVANDSYRDPDLSPLYAPAHDAQSLRDLLRDPEIGGFEPADILVNESKAQIEQAIERVFLDADPGDLVVLYFSGHGVRSRSGRLHLAVGNTDLRLLAATSVSASFIKEMIEESDASSTVLLLDCCYSGAFADTGFKADPQIDVGEELRAGRGTYVLTATNSVQSADDGRPAAGGRPRTLSAFTEAVVRGLSTGAADVRGVGRITPNDLWEYVRQEVPSRTTRQTPTQYGYVEEEVHLANVRRAYPGATVTGGQRVHLGDLLGPLTQTAEDGLRAEAWLGTGRLVVPVGQVFRGMEGAEPVWLDLAHSDGNVLVVGRIGSGKSTLLRTMIGALALTHRPDEVRFYFMESGGNKLGSLHRLPSFAKLAGDDEPAAVRGLLDDLQEVIQVRKRLFRQYDIDSSSRFRAVRDRLPGGPHPDIFLFIDRWAEFVAYQDEVRTLAGGGLEYGVHLVVAARSWPDLPDGLANLMPCHIELGLGSADESRIDPRLAGQIPTDRPGWALHRHSRFLIALPNLATALGPPAALIADSSDGAMELVDRVVQAWSRAPARPPEPDQQTRPEPDLAELIGARTAEGEPAGGTAALEAVTATLGRPPGQPPHQVPGQPPADAGTSPPRPLSTSPDIRDLLAATRFPRQAGGPPTDRPAAAWLRVPIGTDRDGAPVFLDLKEAARGGMGPHGLVVGATGSGKSELLRTLVTALACTHEPTELGIVFIDFKGGAMSIGLDQLPHAAGTITSLAGDLDLVDRMVDALSGELTRRQEVLRAAGNLASHRDYEQARRSGRGDLAPLPSLLVICDEFSELLAVKPELIDLLIAIGRLGRALGVHLLLAGQRLEEGRLRGLDSHLSYRIALRTFSAMESRAVIGAPDAYELPRSPGHGYLKVGTQPPVRFLAAVSFRTVADEGTGESRTVAEYVARTLRASSPPTRRIWLPPLGRRPALDDLLGPVAVRPGRGLTVADPHLHGALRIPVALLDQPLAQRQGPLWLSLAGGDAGGPAHVAVVGGPQSGTSGTLRTLVCALALTHTPAEAQIYCLDFGGDGLASLLPLPHVGVVANRREMEVVRRTIGELAAVLAARTGSSPGAGPAGDGGRAPDIFLVVDNWAALRGEAADLMDAVDDLVARGPRYGIHVLAAAGGWRDFRAGTRARFGNRLELRLRDPAESLVAPGRAAAVPAGSPGRGITAEGEHFLVAAPEVTTVDGGADGLAAAVARAWPGPSAPPVRLLPTDLPYDDLDLSVQDNPWLLPIGIAETDLRQVGVDVAAHPHLLVFADSEGGKSTFLRALTATVCRRFPPEQARIVLIDHRHSLLGDADRSHLIGYGASAAPTASLIDQVAEAIQKRLPGPEVTAQQLRDRSWWTGPELFVVVDDYDLVADANAHPLLPLRDYLAQGADIGLHLVIARRTAGAGRALYDPIIGRLRELDTPGLVMSGDRSEGPLLGDVRPAPLPPGRGWLVTRDAPAQLVQLANLPPTA